MSPEEEDLYLHYLWREILNANTQKRRVLMEHIVNKLSHKILNSQRESLISVFSASFFGVFERKDMSQL